MRVDLPITIDKIKDLRGRIVRYEAELGGLLGTGDTEAEAKQALAGAIASAANTAHPASPIGTPLHGGGMMVVWDAGASGHAYSFLNPGAHGEPIYASGGTCGIPTRQEAIRRARDHWAGLEILPFARAARALGRWCEALAGAAAPKTMFDCGTCWPQLCRCPDREICGVCKRTQGDIDAEIAGGTLPGDLRDCECPAP